MTTPGMDHATLTRLRAIAVVSLAIGYLQVVLGAIVRISGSGHGCGDRWPTCQGAWFPPLERTDLVIELSFRYLSLGLSVAIFGLLLTAWSRRRDAGVAGPGGILRPAGLAALLVVTAAAFGTVLVSLDPQNRSVVVVHVTLALAILAALAVAAIRAGAFGRATADAGGGSHRTFRGVRALVVIIFVVLVLGALTANLPGANASCTGFPLCRNGYGPEFPFQKIQLTHRVLSFAVLFHALGLLIGIRRRAEAALLRQWAATAFLTILLQLLLAAAMVEMHLPLWARSAHQALGTALWLVVVVFVVLVARARGADGAATGAVVPRVPTAPLAGAAARS